MSNEQAQDAYTIMQTGLPWEEFKPVVDTLDEEGVRLLKWYAAEGKKKREENERSYDDNDDEEMENEGGKTAAKKSTAIARQDRVDWGQERGKMTEDEVRIVQPDYDVIGRPSNSKMARLKTFIDGEGYKTGLGLVELTEVEQRNLCRYRITNNIAIREPRQRADPSEQPSWDAAVRTRSQKLEAALDAARKAKGVSVADRQRLQADWAGPTTYPAGHPTKTVRSVRSLGANIIANRGN